MIKVVIGFKRKQGMDVEEFKRYRHDVHVPILLAIPEAEKMRRFVVSYPIDPAGSPEPRFDGLVEVWFDSVDEMNALFYSENFRTKVDPDHANFVDPATVVYLALEEQVVIP